MKSNLDFAPLVLFGYNRLDHIKKVVESILGNVESINTDLFVFLDGPKTIKDKIIGDEIYKYMMSIKGFKKISIKRSKNNKGLGESITSGVTEILTLFEKVIVLEDDLVVSQNFLDYMNQGLNLYNDEERVASIHGYVYPIKKKLPETFFLQGSDCWGWGTWRRAWVKYQPDGNRLLDELQLKGHLQLFDFDGFGGYIEMLEDSIRGKNDSWAIKWYATTFLLEMYTLYPGRSLVRNIGMDGTGTHKGIFRQSILQDIDKKIVIQKIPIQDSKIAREEFVKYFNSAHSFNLTRLKSIMLNNIKKVFDV